MFFLKIAITLHITVNKKYKNKKKTYINNVYKNNILQNILCIHLYISHKTKYQKQIAMFYKAHIGSSCFDQQVKLPLIKLLIKKIQTSFYEQCSLRTSGIDFSSE